MFAQKTFIVETRDDLDAERPPESPLLRRAVALFSGLLQATLETRIPQWLLGKCQPVPEGGGSISVSIDNLLTRENPAISGPFSQRTEKLSESYSEWLAAQS